MSTSWVQRMADRYPEARFARWQPIAHPPRRLWVTCFACSLRGWSETVATPRLYRCDECRPEWAA